ncbi:hypothetical protein SJ05684_c25070 [Sinorhizobium sojae CCBAU 05684]|uniref:Uncharacterized protein n=1 Tax=Sinorhizobium sojae CCBAU 05684 TaxID=716928 RepID=A0A249PDQ0_9HYPH|nr:hypothetical protein [Sinorhizobium sojae]ASY63946.1 hypothetical protein SJ05684_c25070 [Sinorhizobium sojae CCBAU 05684]
MPKSPKIPERLWFKFLGHETLAEGRFSIACAVLIAVLRMLLRLGVLVLVGKAAARLM